MKYPRLFTIWSNGNTRYRVVGRTHHGYLLCDKWDSNNQKWLLFNHSVHKSIPDNMIQNQPSDQAVTEKIRSGNVSINALTASLALYDEPIVKLAFAKRYQLLLLNDDDSLGELHPHQKEIINNLLSITD